MKMDGKYDDDMMDDMAHDGKHGEHDEKHKIMTMDDVASCLADDFEDEIHDCEKYHCMAKVAERSGCENDAHYLMEMSKDEYTHAKFIYMFMCDHGMHVDEGHKHEFDELTHKMEEFF